MGQEHGLLVIWPSANHSINWGDLGNKATFNIRPYVQLE